MLSNNKLRPYIFIFLAFCVVSSKHIIIYNEEILVALSFLLFIIFVSHYFGNNIKDSLDERSKAIKLELQNFLTLKQESLNELLKEHKKISLLKSALKNVGTFTNFELKQTSSGSEKALNKVFSQQIHQKLKTLSYSKTNLQQKLQQIMAENLLTAVLVKFKSLKTKQVDPVFVQKAIKLLAATK